MGVSFSRVPFLGLVYRGIKGNPFFEGSPMRDSHISETETPLGGVSLRRRKVPASKNDSTKRVLRADSQLNWDPNEKVRLVGSESI